MVKQVLFHGNEFPSHQIGIPTNPFPSQSSRINGQNIPSTHVIGLDPGNFRILRTTPVKFNIFALEKWCVVGRWSFPFGFRAQFQGRTAKLQDISLSLQTPNMRRYLDPKNIPKTFIITAYHYKSLYNRVGFHPLFTLREFGFRSQKRSSEYARSSGSSFALRCFGRTFFLWRELFGNAPYFRWWFRIQL